MHLNPCYFRYFTMATNCRITVSSMYSLDNTGLPSDVTCSVSVVDTGSLSDTSTLVIRIGTIGKSCQFVTVGYYLM